MGFGRQAQVCVLSAEQEQGPFYIKDEMLRPDVAEGKPGLPLALRLVVMDSRSCKPLSNVAVDIWSCDAMGLYAGFTTQSMNMMGPGGPEGSPSGRPPAGPPPGFDSRHPGDRPGAPPENHPTDKLTFLRGVQITGTDGIVNFRTVFPGFYQGRTNHVHFKVRVGVTADGMSLPSGHISHTGQVFFPEEIAAELMTHPPYSNHAIHRTTQQEDGVFTRQHGAASVASFRKLKEGHGYSAELIAAVDPTATPAAVGPGGPPPF